MIRTCLYVPGEEFRSDIAIKEISKSLDNPGAMLWIDFENHSDAEAEAILTGIFRFHPLAVDDALKQTHTPKIDDWGEYIYIVLNALSFVGDHDIEVQIKELDIFLGKNFVVTHHDEPIPSIEKAWKSIFIDYRYTAQGPDHLVYKLIDEVVADCWPMVQIIDDEIDILEDQVFLKASPSMLERMFDLKRSLVTMRRIITPQREVLNRLARDDFQVVDEKDRIFFRDIYDHLVRLYDLNESMRDLLSSVMDTYLSVVNNRMNEIMKVLTIITTLFMPISFITGFFGMNFFEPTAGLTHWTSYAAFIIMLCVTVGLPVTMFWWMKHRTWV